MNGARRVVAAAVAVVACACPPRLADARAVSTAEERARFVRGVRSLESDPLTGDAAVARQRLRQWALDVPDIRFKVCPGLLGEAAGDGYAYWREFDAQVLLSGAVLTIEDPGKARDDAAVYAAGVEGALRAYEATRRSRPDAQSAALDDLIRKRDRGELADHIAGLAAKNCRRSNPLLIASPIGAGVGLLLALLVARGFVGHGSPVHGNRRGILTPRAAGTVRRIVFVCVGYYLVVAIALHVLEPHYDPRFQAMSDYAWGTYGWLMTTTFFVLGLAAVTLAIGLRHVHRSSWTARTGCGLLVVGAAFVCLAGVFRGFPLHEVASAVGIPSLVMAAVMLSWSFRDAAAWRTIRRASLLMAVGMSAAIVSMIVDIGMPGLQQRLFLGLLLAWLSLVAHRLVFLEIPAK